MREQLESLMINSFMSYKQLERILEESEKIPARDMQTLKNLQREFFKIINSFVRAIPETKNEDKKENKNNEDKNELIV